jgi:hypothetical protein
MRPEEIDGELVSAFQHFVEDPTTRQRDVVFERARVLTGLLRDEGWAAERVIVALREASKAAGGDAPAHRIVDSLISACIKEYFRH